MLARHAFWLAAMALLCGAVGCRLVAAIGILTAPPQIKKAEFKLAPGRLAVLLETARPSEDNPVFAQAFHDKLVEEFRQYKIPAQVVSRDEVLRARQENADFDRWSVQKVGRWVFADQVLYVRVESLQLYEAPGSPVLAPRVQMRVKVIGVGEAADTARLWPGPDEPDGRLIERARPQKEAADTNVIDAETAKLGREAAILVVMPFRDVDLEQKPGWEP